MWFTIVATLLVALLIYKLFCPKKAPDFWGKYGIRQIDTSPGISLTDCLLGRKPIFAGDDYVYSTLLENEKFAGVMELGKPVLVLKDVELIKKVLIKDFEYFADRRDFFSDQASSVKRMLMALKGDEWKGVRSSISPTFTTGKIRRMMEIFNSIGKEWVEDLVQKTKASVGGGGTGSVTVDMLKTTNQYTIDVIGSAVFGMATGTIKNPNSTFCKMATRLTGVTTWQLVKTGIFFAAPKLGGLLRLSVFDKSALEYLEAIFDVGLKARLKGDQQNSRRNDFLQLLVEAKRGKLKGVGEDELNTFEKEAELQNNQEYHLTDEMINAQSLVFFFAGFSTTSNLITFVAYILAAHPDVQDKVRKEVRGIAREDGSFDYDALNHLVYLDMVICEVNRIYPVTGRLERRCVKDYKDPESRLVIPKGTIVAIPVNSLHNDTKYYSHPGQFHPEHFTPDRKAERSPYVYLPFGMGPRNCIGMRFGVTETKAAVAHLVLNFLVQPSEKTPLPVHGVPAAWQLVPPKNLELKLTPIKLNKNQIDL